MKTKAILRVGVFAGVLASACNSGPPTPSASSLSAGQWSGTTVQGASISFSVSSDEALTTIAVGYTFNGCSGTQTFADLNVPTAPNVTCIPGPWFRFGTILAVAPLMGWNGQRRATERALWGYDVTRIAVLGRT